MLPYVHRADGQKDRRTKLIFNFYSGLQLVMSRWTMDDHGTHHFPYKMTSFREQTRWGWWAQHQPWWLLMIEKSSFNLFLIGDIANIDLSPFSWLALDGFLCTYKYIPRKKCVVPSINCGPKTPGSPGGKICLNSKNFTSPGVFKTSFVQSSETFGREGKKNYNLTTQQWGPKSRVMNGMITPYTCAYKWDVYIIQISTRKKSHWSRKKENPYVTFHSTASFLWEALLITHPNAYKELG